MRYGLIKSSSTKMMELQTLADQHRTFHQLGLELEQYF